MQLPPSSWTVAPTLVLLLSLPAAPPGHPPAQDAGAPRSFVCPPCGADCHAQTYDAEGSCSVCGMALVPEESVPVVTVLLFEGCDLASWTRPVSVFAAASGAFVHLVADTTDPVRCGAIVTVVPDRALSDEPVPDVLILPSGYASLWDDSLVLDWITQAGQGAEHVIAVGVGGLVAARAGLLAEKRVAVAGYAARLVERIAPEFAAVTDEPLLKDGRVISAADPAAAEAAAYDVLAEIAGPEAAAHAARMLGRER